MLFDDQRRPVDFRCIWVNKNFETLTGLKKAEGKNVTELIPGIRASNPELLETCGRVSLTETSERFEMYVEPLARWFSVSVYSHQKEFFVATFQNITERKQIENDLESAKTAARNVLEDLQSEKDALAKAKAKDDALLASIGDGVLAIDEGGRLIMVNESASRLLLWPPSFALGEELMAVLPVRNESGQPIPPEKHPLYRALRYGQNVTTTTTTILYFVRRNGEQFPVSVTATPTRLGGKVVGAVGVFRDVTNEVNLNLARRDFMNIAAHDLRTPISAIKGFVQMIRRGDFGTAPGGEIGEALSDIEEGTDRMIELINTFLTVARIEQGTLRLRPVPTDVGPLLDELHRAWLVTSGNRPVTVAVEAPKSLPRIVADRTAIAEVLMNLVDNAFKHTERGGITVTVHAPKAGFVEVTVADTGQGIPPEELPRMFERYFRGSVTEVAPGRGGGLGLGLYTAKMLIEALGGKIWAESTVGKGTTIHFSLPVAV